MTAILTFLLVIGVLVFVHELGHFLAARRLGVRVLTFSIGFGPTILRVVRGDTEYCVKAIPLGGYVKMAGGIAGSPRSPAPDEFLSRSKWQRFQILAAGPAMNLLLAVLLLAVALSPGAATPFDAIRLSVERNVEYGGQILQLVGGLATGTTPVGQMQGVISIAILLGQSVDAGWMALLALMAALSLNIGILNLLPIPILDGGHIAIMALEGIAGRNFSEQAKERLALGGLVALMALMVTVTYQDVARLVWS